MSRRTIVSSIAAVVLSAAIAGPMLAAGGPTFSGTLTCVRVSDGDVVELDSFSGATKKDVQAAKRYWSSTGYCEKGSIDSSGITKDV